MRHRIKTKIFHRKRDQRSALIKHYIRDLVRLGRIETTVERARYIRPFIEKLITRAKNDTIANRRYSARILPPVLVKSLFVTITPRYKERRGGYIRIIKKGRRKGDNAEIAVMEFV